MAQMFPSKFKKKNIPKLPPCPRHFYEENKLVVVKVERAFILADADCTFSYSCSLFSTYFWTAITDRLDIARQKKKQNRTKTKIQTKQQKN